jgi:hypothetical protein
MEDQMQEVRLDVIKPKIAPIPCDASIEPLYPAMSRFF